MPLYEFYCSHCKKEIALTLTIKERERDSMRCPDCHGKLEPRMATFFPKTSRKS